MKKKVMKIMKKTRLGKFINRNIQAKKRLKLCKELSSKTKVNEKQIIFSAFQGRLFACSPKAIYKYMIKDPKFKDFTFIWAFNKPDSKKDYFLDERTKVVKYNSTVFYNYLASSKYWVFNFKTPDWFIKKDNQIFVQCWHGTPLKRLGLDINVNGNSATDKAEIHDSYLKDAKKYDYFISPSKFASEKFISSFGLDKLHKKDIILEKGYPRNDSLFFCDRDNCERLKESLGIKKNKKIILYCPTFRDNQYKKGVGHTYELGVNLLRLKEYLPDDYILLLRLHYLVSNNIDISQFKGFAIDVSDYDDVNDLYLVSDMLITDYSSVFFDYANLRKPIIFYMYDLKEYKENLRDFYIDIKQLPGPIVETEKELIEKIQRLDMYKTEYEEKYDEFCEKYTYLDDGNAAERVVKEFINYEDAQQA